MEEEKKQEEKEEAMAEKAKREGHDWHSRQRQQGKECCGTVAAEAEVFEEGRGSVGAAESSRHRSRSAGHQG